MIGPARNARTRQPARIRASQRGRVGVPEPVRVQAFTLLEVLIVLTILGVITATVMLSFTGADQEQALKGAAERMALRIELARQRSLTRNREWGIYVEADSYRFAEFDPEGAEGGNWVPQSRRPFDKDDLPERVRLMLELEEYDDLPFEEGDDFPQILIFSSGEITPFRILIEPEWRTTPWVVGSDGLEQVTASREGAT
ncbi:MAG: type II secretion system minor pseudopilin GspH [Pseudomonadales bacterium]